MVSFSIGNPLGYYAFLSLIPLIILYLIRPKPKKMDIPSLMFFLKQKEKAIQNSFLRYITKDWLFLLQLLILSLLAFSLTDPILAFSESVSANNVVIVLDVSASSQVMEDSKTRFEIGVDKAKNSLGKTNSIVLVKNEPFIPLRDKDSGEVARYLNSLVPSDTSSNLGDAILIAGEILGSNEGKVVIISDFINTGGTNPSTAINVLKTKGYSIETFNTANFDVRKRNIGIIDLIVDEAEAAVYVKNYNRQAETVTLNINGVDKKLNIPPGSVQTMSFVTPEGTTVLDLKVKDDFPVDNKAFISNPRKSGIKVLIISNGGPNFISSALKSSGIVDIEIASPPILPKGSYDIYVLHDLDKGEILAGTFEEIGLKVENGADLIIHYQADMQSIDYKGLLPVNLEGRGSRGVTKIDQTNRFTQDIDFGIVTDYNLGSVKSKASSLVSVDDRVSTPLIAMQTREKGRIIYFGIPEHNDFKTSPGYPIFWVELLNFLVNQEDITEANIIAGHPAFKDPSLFSGTPELLILDKVGLHKSGDKFIAVNLLNDIESDINFDSRTVEKVGQRELELIGAERSSNIIIALIIASLIFLMLELFYVKLRGDV